MSVALQFIDTKDLVQELMRRDDTTDIIKMFLDREGIKRMNLVTLKEFKEYLKVSDVTARNMIKEAEAQNLYTVIKVGVSYRVDLISFEEYVMKNALKDRDVMKKKKGVIQLNVRVLIAYVQFCKQYNKKASFEGLRKYNRDIELVNLYLPSKLKIKGD